MLVFHLSKFVNETIHSFKKETEEIIMTEVFVLRNRNFTGRRPH